MSNEQQGKPLSDLAVVILAAGAATRYGQPKQLVDWFGEPLLLSVIRDVEACGYKPYITLGANRERISQHPKLANNLGQLIVVDNWADGMAASIAASTAFLKQKSVRGIVFLLADQPLIGQAHLQRLVSLAQEQPAETVCTSYNAEQTEYGVPAYFPEELFDQLLALQADQGAKWLLRSVNARSIQIESELPLNLALLDIDEPDDLVRAKAIYLQSR